MTKPNPNGPRRFHGRLKPRVKSKKKVLVKIPGIGAPDRYTIELGKTVCQYILLGYTIKQIGAIKGMPSRVTIYEWLRIHEEFSDEYAKVREESAHTVADSVLEIAEEVRKGRLAPDQGRVVIDAAKWAAGKRKPKVYSDKLQVIGDDSNPIRHKVDVTMSPAEAYAKAIKP